jgi:hypothetical protein
MDHAVFSLAPQGYLLRRFSLMYCALYHHHNHHAFKDRPHGPLRLQYYNVKETLLGILSSFSLLADIPY